MTKESWLFLSAPSLCTKTNGDIIALAGVMVWQKSSLIVMPECFSTWCNYRLCDFFQWEADGLDSQFNDMVR